MKKLLILLVPVLLIATASFAETFNVSTIPAGSRLIKAYEKDSGKYLWQSVVTVRKLKSGGRVTIEVIEDGIGVWNNKDKRMWRAESFYSLVGGKVTPQRGMLTFCDTNGNITDTIEKSYSLKNSRARFIKNGKKNDFDFDSDLIDKEILGTCVMNYPFGRKENFEFHMMTNEPSHYKMTMVNKGIEKIKVGNKTVECYKLQMIPDLGFLGIFAPFVPKTYFWHKVEPPHDFVRYEGLESGLNTPYIYMEASD